MNSGPDRDAQPVSGINLALGTAFNAQAVTGINSALGEVVGASADALTAAPSSQSAPAPAVVLPATPEEEKEDSVNLDRVEAMSHGKLQKLADEVSETMPFIATSPENAQRRAARFIISVCEAVVYLQQRDIVSWDEAACKHYQRTAQTEWDNKDDNVNATLPSTSALSMMGNMKLGVTQDDWPPCADTAPQSKFQFVWTHFPCAKGPDYASYPLRQLYEPTEQTLDRFQKDVEVQIGFTMDVMIAARDEVSKLEPARGDYVAMVFNPVGAGAFVDALSSEEQTLCLGRIMRAMIGALEKRAPKKCVLFVSGGQMDGNGVLSWTNKQGNAASVAVEPEVRDCLVAGSFDCLALAQKLAGSGLFCHVGVTMAADKQRIGNAWLSCHFSRVTQQLQFSAWNASDENNTRRSSLVPWVLKANAPRFKWYKINPAAVQRVKDTQSAAEKFLGQPDSCSYNQMINGFKELLDGDLKLLKANSMKIRVPELRRGIETAMVGDLQEHPGVAS